MSSQGNLPIGTSFPNKTPIHSPLPLNQQNGMLNNHSRLPSNTVIDIGSWPDIDIDVNNYNVKNINEKKTTPTTPPPPLSTTAPTDSNNSAPPYNSSVKTSTPSSLNLMNDTLDLELLLNVQPFLHPSSDDVPPNIIINNPKEQSHYSNSDIHISPAFHNAFSTQTKRDLNPPTLNVTNSMTTTYPPFSYLASYQLSSCSPTSPLIHNDFFSKCSVPVEQATNHRNIPFPATNGPNPPSQPASQTPLICSADYKLNPQTNLISSSTKSSTCGSIYPKENRASVQLLNFAGQRSDLRAAITAHGSNFVWVTLPPMHKRRSNVHPKLLETPSDGIATNSLSQHRMSIVRRTRDSTLFKLTLVIIETYQSAHPGFQYAQHLNPRRVLTKPSKPAKNEGFDNDDNDYILYVNDFIGDDPDRRYQIVDIMGQGTFGQVVKCLHIKSQLFFAVKVVKNKPAYFNQSLMEVNVLERLNSMFDQLDTQHIIRLIESFVFRRHLCLVFEPLSINLYELIKQNQFRGLNLGLVRIFTSQILDAISCLAKARLIHCDLKPENILLCGLHENQLKVIDFGSACHEHQTVYTYIQSRFYRSPEVLLGLPYTNAIDMWSLGCIVAELFLGLPLFPGTSEYNQVSRIVDMMGVPPNHMIEVGKNAKSYFHKVYITPNSVPSNSPGILPSAIQQDFVYKLKSREQYSQEFSTNEQVSKRYFTGNSIREVIVQYPMSRKLTKHERENQVKLRDCLVDFLHGVLCMNPIERWSAQQAKLHPFVTGSAWNGPWQPVHAPNPKTQAPLSSRPILNGEEPLCPVDIQQQYVTTIHNPNINSSPSITRSITPGPSSPPITRSITPGSSSPARSSVSTKSLNNTNTVMRRQRSRTMSSANSSNAGHSPLTYIPMISGQAMAAAASVYRQQQRKSSIADLSASLQDRVRRGSMADNLGAAASAAAIASSLPKTATTMSHAALFPSPLASRARHSSNPHKYACLPDASNHLGNFSPPLLQQNQSTSALFTTGLPIGRHQELPKLRKGRSQSISISAASTQSNFHITAATAAAGWITSPYHDRTYLPANPGHPSSLGTSACSFSLDQCSELKNNYPKKSTIVAKGNSTTRESEEPSADCMLVGSEAGVPTWNPSYRIIPTHLELEDWHEDVMMSQNSSTDQITASEIGQTSGSIFLMGLHSSSPQPLSLSPIHPLSSMPSHSLELTNCPVSSAICSSISKPEVSTSDLV